MIPQKLSHYSVLEQIGAGGMGVVYRAHDDQLDRDVALKVLTPGTLSDDRARQRFRREALALARLNHPNIGAVYEFGSDAGVDFLVMELVSGVTLDAKLTAGPIPEREVTRLGAQLADGLDAAHSQGVIHRDLKPGNLRLTSDGRLKILDFGLAQWADTEDASAITATLTRNDHEISGTLPYMAPEQLRGHKADARTDIYSCGAVLYEMVTGKRPFPGVSGPQLVGAILEQPISRPSATNRHVSSALESIILKALDKEPERRYQSAREMKIDLERLSSGVVPMAAKPRPRWGLIVSLLAAVAIAIAAAFSVGGWRNRTHPPSAPVVNLKSRPSVAVLGFKNLSGNPEEAWISTALSEMLTTELAAGEQVRTVSGENVARMKSDLSLSDADSFAPDTLGRIHKNLGSDLVVLGSYLALGKEVGGKIRLDFRLQDTKAGETIATVSETATEGDLIDLVSRTGAELRQKIGIAGVSAADASLVRTALPSNPEAARLYSEGLEKLRVFEALAARDLFTQSIKIEPDHALSHSALAAAWSALGYDAKSQEEAKKAFDLSSGLSREDRLAVEGRYREATHDWPAAVEIYRTLSGFFPDNLEYGLRLASAQISSGAAKDAMTTIQALRKSSPHGESDGRVDLAESKAELALGDFKQAQQAAANAESKGRAQGSRLVIAQARSAQGRALERLGKADDATAAFTEAQSLFTAAGDKINAASAINLNGNVLYDRGDFAGARKAYEESLAVFRDVGAKERAASALNNIGNVYYEQGDLEHARDYYQQTLDLDREVGDKASAAGSLGNLANVLDSMGDLKGALKMQQEGLDAFREVGDKRGTASTLGNFGNLLAEMGDLEAAKAKYEEGLKLQRASGYQRGVAYITYGLSDVFTAQGQLAEARKYAEEAAGIRRDLKELGNIAGSNVQLANLALEEGKPAAAEPPARAAADEFDKEKVSDNGATAYAVLAVVQLAQNKLSDAQASANRAMSLSQQTSYKPPRFDATTAKARVQAASGDAPGALRLLEALHAEAVKYGYVPYEFESRLAMGQIEMKSGKTASGRASLAQLEKDSRAKGYLLLADKAARAAK
jgi:serine/threonine protein kinase/tetratricopeptide (TPR) repeat protein